MPYPTIFPTFQARLNLTDYAETQLLRKLLGFSSTIPANFYAALGRYASGAGTAFGEAGTGGLEPVGNNYARAVLPRATASWTDPALNIQATYGGTPFSRVRCWLAVEVVWPEITPAVWDTGGDPEYLGFFDAATGGNCWMEMHLNPQHLSTAAPGNQYFIPLPDPSLLHEFPALVCEDLTLGAFAVSWKIKFLDWLLRGVDFTAPTPYLGFVKRDTSASPGTPNMVDETVTEVTTSGTGYSRHDVSGSFDPPLTVSGQTYAPLNTTETWSASGDWGFSCCGALFDGPGSGGANPLLSLETGLFTFFHPHSGDTVNVGPGVPGTGGMLIGITP